MSPAASDPSQPIVLLGCLPDLATDCACPVPPRAGGAPERAATRWVKAQELYSAPLVDEWLLYCNPLQGGPPSVLSHGAVRRLEQFAAPAALVEAVDEELATARLLVPEGTRPAAPNGAPTQLTAWIHVTNACNLECPYCYIRKSAARMSDATGVRAVDSLITTARRRGFTRLKLKYAGGEAALHYRLIQRLHAYAAEQASACGLELEAVVLSNGTVMPEAFAEWLAGAGVRLMLSVDGVGADHDRQRPWKHGGDGAFTALEANLTTRLLPRGVRPDICITVTGQTAHTAQGAVRWAIEHDLPFALNFYREHEQSASHRELRYEEQQLIVGLLGAYAVVEELLPARPLLDGLLDRVQAEAHGHTCGVGQSYVVITHEGTVAQCQMELQRAVAFGAGSDLIALVAAGPLHNLGVDQKEGCRSCHWRYRCSGGCPLVTLRATGRSDVQSPNCNIYKALLPAALRLEGLRTLKVAGRLSAAS